MPYYSNYGQDDKENQGGAAGQGQSTGTGTFQRGGNGADQTNEAPSGAGTIADSPGAASGAAQKNAANTGSQYQSLDKYLGANADSNFGNQVTGKVGDAQAKGAGDQTDTTQQFNNQVVSSNRVPTKDQISGAVENPASADAKQYQQWMNQTYYGPKSLSGSPSLQNQYWDSTNKAVTQTGQIAGNDTGQYSLLNSYFGGPAGSSSYSSNNGPTGEQGLDLSLAQNTAGYGQNVAGLQRGAANLQQHGNSGAAALQNNASAQAANVANSANSARAAIGVDAQGQIVQGAGAGAIGNLESQINQGVTDANAATPAGLTALQTQLKSGNISGLTPAQLSAMGLTAGQNTYGADLSGDVTAGPAFTAANTMTPEQLAQLKALQGLAGVAPDTLASTTLAAGNPYSYNAGGAQGAVTTAHSASDKAGYTQAQKASQTSLPKIELGGGGLWGTGIGGGRSINPTQVSTSQLGLILSQIGSGKPIEGGGQLGESLNQLDGDAGALQNFVKVAQPIYQQQMAALKAKFNQT